MLQLEASARGDFHATVGAAGDAISAVGGWIVDHRFYSSTLAVLSFQVPPDKAVALAQALSARGIALHSPPPVLAHGERDVAGQLSITFADGGPDIRRDVPAFG